ncbi:SprT-like domain-containing protein [Lapillicoccus jejuensis]|uniref:SprT-like family protein n=1 Tax=Lapillicoccus jejuensis TaxID=402171 RepID=A0A542DZ18_9MICO|nr:SprT-like domain-containing protein [Lapillicoccus jejuensis]TQJ08327.1 SprT-like family protein [Lapillicoccus jejuensis]
MDTSEAMRLADGLVARHGLAGWSVEFDTAVTRAGACHFALRRITLSAPLVRLYSRDQVQEVVLHEIAHALAGADAGHGPRWRRLARELGATGRRCVDPSAPQVEGAWVGTCPAGHRSTRHRRPVRVVSCAVCSPRFDLAHLVEWTHHGAPASAHPRYAAELLALGVLAADRLPVDVRTVRRPRAGAR